MDPLNATASPRLKLRLSAAAERAIRRGHPWVFADRVRSQNRAGRAGEFAVVFDRNDRFLALGLYDPDSPIALRVLHAGRPAELTEAWWRIRFLAPLTRRLVRFDPRTTGYRCLNGESDGWPGLVLDRYTDCWVIKLYTAAWFPHLDRIAQLIAESVRPDSIVLRLSRNIQPAAARHGLHDGQLVFGAPVLAPVIFHEHGLQFEADVHRGQKTGFFLDQRENRRRVGDLAAGRQILNLFSHAGGFSVHAAAGGARSALDIDLSATALDAARRNFALNTTFEGVRQCRHQTLCADAFDWIAQNSRQTFDVVIIDPPSLAARAADRAAALAAYQRLATAGAILLEPRGVLVAASCSAHVTAAEFFKIVRGAARRQGSRWEELGTTGHPPDHPAAFPEALYLKCIYLRKINGTPPRRRGPRAGRNRSNFAAAPAVQVGNPRGTARRDPVKWRTNGLRWSTVRAEIHGRTSVERDGVIRSHA